MPGPLEFTSLQGGRNGIDFPLNLLSAQCAEALNVDFFQGPLGRKRGGMTAVAQNGGTQITTAAYAMFRHLPTGDESLAEWWLVDGAGVFKRLAGGTTWEDIPLDDPFIGLPQDVTFTSFNGKLFIAYPTQYVYRDIKKEFDRLHVYDPVRNLIRRVGLEQNDRPTVSNGNASGTFPAGTYYVRTRTVDYDGTKVLRRSEPSPSIPVTADGVHQGLLVELDTPPHEHETHWEVEFSTDDSIFYVVAGAGGYGDPVTLPGTTTYLIETGALSYNEWSTAISDFLSEEIGLFQLPPCAAFLTTDGNRLIMAGSYSNNFSCRVWLTPVLGSADHGDDERVVSTATIKSYVDLNEKDGGRITGVSAPIQGTFFVFKYRQTWKLLPTSDNAAPYLPRQISHAIGCIRHQSIVMAEDSLGNPIVGFLSHRGPYRVSVTGLDAMSRDVEDIWFGLNGQSAVNLDASTIVGHGVYYSDLRQIWWYLSVGSGNSPSVKIVQDVRHATLRDQYGVRGGWSVHTGKSCQAASSVMFSSTLGAAMSRALKPHIGYLAAP